MHLQYLRTPDEEHRQRRYRQLLTISLALLLSVPMLAVSFGIYEFMIGTPSQRAVEAMAQRVVNGELTGMSVPEAAQLLGVTIREPNRDQSEYFADLGDSRMGQVYCLLTVDEAGEITESRLRYPMLED